MKLFSVDKVDQEKMWIAVFKVENMGVFYCFCNKNWFSIYQSTATQNIK